ncbi:MAG: hypothetical protein WCA56_17800, partial [Xanthobacteraceae bacterium]
KVPRVLKTFQPRSFVAYPLSPLFRRRLRSPKNRRQRNESSRIITHSRLKIRTRRGRTAPANTPQRDYANPAKRDPMRVFAGILALACVIDDASPEKFGSARSRSSRRQTRTRNQSLTPMRSASRVHSSRRDATIVTKR